jgi:putative nucleotidyltransferase with HDIG domain
VVAADVNAGDGPVVYPARDAALATLLPILGAQPGDVWVVGGAVRDLLLGRPVEDADLAVRGDARALARSLHESLGGDVFSLSDRFGTWRVQPAGRTWRIDVSPLRGDTIEEDLAQRDFTAGAIALPAGGPFVPVDPLGGIGDIASGTLRVLGEHAYRDDPLRPLRLPRLAAQLGFAPDEQTAALTRRHATRVAEAAPERVFAELRDLVCGANPLRGLALMDELGITRVVLPELVELQGVEQSVYHHKDVYGHTLEVLERTIELEHDLETVFGPSAPRLRAQLDKPLANEMTRGQALRWAALLHDIAKPRTRVVRDDGRVGFPHHDELGATMVRAICRRLHTSERFTEYLAALTRHHLRLGFLVGQAFDRRAIYAYLTACQPVELEVGVLSVADRLATRGRKFERAAGPHLAIARELAAASLEWRERHAQEPPLVRGDELAHELGIEPGPQLGELLAAIDEARYVGDVTTAAEAIELARNLAR